MTFLRSLSRSILLFEHDLFGKPVPTFPDHALAIGGGPETRYALTNHRMRLVWGAAPRFGQVPGQIADIDAGIDLERPYKAPADGVRAKRRSALHGDGRDGRGGAH